MINIIRFNNLLHSNINHPTSVEKYVKNTLPIIISNKIQIINAGFPSTLILPMLLDLLI